jgi:hypothetical protein
MSLRIISWKILPVRWKAVPAWYAEKKVASADHELFWYSRNQ